MDHLPFQYQPTANELKKYIVSTFSAAGYNLWVTNAGKIRNVKLAPKNTPDTTGYAPWGTFVGIEVKAGDDTLTDGQLKWLRDAAARGCLVAVISSYEDIPVIIRTWKNDRSATVKSKSVR